MSKIHGLEVEFHSHTNSVRELLEHGMHSTYAKKYFDKALSAGHAYIIDWHGDKFKIESKKEEGGEVNYSLRKSNS